MCHPPRRRGEPPCCSEPDTPRHRSPQWLFCRPGRVHPVAGSGNLRASLGDVRGLHLDRERNVLFDY